MIDEIRKRLEAATQRPLILGPIPRECYCDDSNATFLARVSRAALEVIYDGDVVNLGEDEEADFIYHAPADIAYLLKRVEQLEAVRTAELWFKEVWQVTQLHFGNQHGELKEMLASLEHAQDAIDLALAALEVQKGKADDQK